MAIARSRSPWNSLSFTRTHARRWLQFLSRRNVTAKASSVVRPVRLADSSFPAWINPPTCSLSTFFNPGDWYRSDRTILSGRKSDTAKECGPRQNDNRIHRNPPPSKSSRGRRFVQEITKKCSNDSKSADENKNLLIWRGQDHSPSVWLTSTSYPFVALIPFLLSVEVGLSLIGKICYFNV